MAAGVLIERHYSYIGSDKNTCTLFPDEEDVAPILKELGVEVTTIREKLPPQDEIRQFFTNPREWIRDMVHKMEMRGLQ